jgi:hypothetical protein
MFQHVLVANLKSKRALNQKLLAPVHHALRELKAETNLITEGGVSTRHGSDNFAHTNWPRIDDRIREIVAELM